MSIKKLLLVGVVVGAGVFAFRHTKIAAHAKSEVTNFVEWVESTVPPEKEIARLRKDVSALDKDIKNVSSALAKETVDVKNLREVAGKLKEQVSKEYDTIVKRGQEISNATEKVSHGSRMISAPEAKELLNADVTRHLSRKKALAAMETSLGAKEKVKETLDRQLDELKKKKIELAAEIDTIESEFNVLKLQQMESKFAFDDSRLSRIKQSLQELKRKHDIAAEELKLAPVVNAETPSVDTMSVDEILGRLGGDKAEKKAEGKISKN